MSSRKHVDFACCHHFPVCLLLPIGQFRNQGFPNAQLQKDGIRAFAFVVFINETLGDLRMFHLQGVHKRRFVTGARIDECSIEVEKETSSFF
jgi:hypothetical protein